MFNNTHYIFFPAVTHSASPFFSSTQHRQLYHYLYYYCAFAKTSISNHVFIVVPYTNITLKHHAYLFRKRILKVHDCFHNVFCCIDVHLRCVEAPAPCCICRLLPLLLQDSPVSSPRRRRNQYSHALQSFRQPSLSCTTSVCGGYVTHSNFSDSASSRHS